MPEARTRPIDPFAGDFRQWATAQGPVSIPPPAPRRRTPSPQGSGTGEDADTVARQLTSFHSYCNCRGDVDWNTCGQAAIASITDYHGLNPYNLSRVGQYWDDGAAIDAIINGGFGPDVAFGWGTTGGRIRDALNSYGLNASMGFTGLFSSGWQDQWQALNDYVSQNLPVPVLVDVGRLGGTWWTAHWPIAYRIEGGYVYLGNPIGSAMVDEATFLSAWHCWFLPYGFNHCGVYCY
jgi:hypothetical protein